MRQYEQQIKEKKKFYANTSHDDVIKYTQKKGENCSFVAETSGFVTLQIFLRANKNVFMQLK